MTENMIKTKGMDIILLMGDTGAGKSTILNMVAGSKVTARFNDDNGSWELDASPKIAMIGHTIS